MANKNGTIDLGSVRTITGVVKIKGICTFQLFSSDLSATTDIAVEGSLDGGTSWGAMEESGVAITDSLVVDVVKLISVECDAPMKVRINFGGATTGNVAYYHTLL